MNSDLEVGIDSKMITWGFCMDCIISLQQVVTEQNPWNSSQFIVSRSFAIVDESLNEHRCYSLSAFFYNYENSRELLWKGSIMCRNLLAYLILMSSWNPIQFHLSRFQLLYKLICHNPNKINAHQSKSQGSSWVISFFVKNITNMCAIGMLFLNGSSLFVHKLSSIMLLSWLFCLAISYY